MNGPTGVFSTIVSLVGLTLIFAIFAGLYYSNDNVEFRENGAPAFVIAPHEARATSLQPSLPDSWILVELEIKGGHIDIYTMNADWAAQLPDKGVVRLDKPFSFQAEHSFLNVTGNFSFNLPSDGSTWQDIILDNTDNYYVDTPPSTQPVEVILTTRYLAEEQRSLMFGYIATVPSIILVLVLVGRKVWRVQRRREERIARELALAAAQQPKQ